jgi:hypothetical protein
MLLMTIIPLVASGKIENEFEKKDFQLDVYQYLRFERKNGKIPLVFFQRWNPLMQIFFKHLDIVSFSIFEDSDEPEFLQAKMKIRNFKYSELRSWYGIYWVYKDIRYFVGTNTHTKGEKVGSIAGYFNEDKTGNYSIINGEINEEENTLTWTIPKDIIGHPQAGEQLEEICAYTYLIYQKDCDARIKLYLATDRANPLINQCYSYIIQY